MKLAYLGELRLWWQRLPVDLHSPIWPGLLAMLPILGLLLAFHQVVSGAVQQGELRRAATAAHATATWRCGALSVLQLRESCLASLGATVRDAASPQSGNAAAAAQRNH